jgi:hypothetical protein
MLCKSDNLINNCSIAMASIKNITSGLSVAAAVLLEACSSSGSGSESGPTAVSNTLAPQLIGTWQTACIATESSGTSPDTTTQASGGSGSGSISGGAAYRTSAIFTQDGHVELILETFATANCNASKLSSLNRYNAVYYIGGDGSASDGSPVMEIDYSDNRSTTYSIFQIVSSSELYLGEPSASSPGQDGSSEDARYDGLGPRMLK